VEEVGIEKLAIGREALIVTTTESREGEEENIGGIHSGGERQTGSFNTEKEGRGYGLGGRSK